MSENRAIRLLELLADLYAKTHPGGKPSVYYVDQVPRNRWSLAAVRAEKVFAAAEDDKPAKSTTTA